MNGRIAFESITYAMRARDLLMADREMARGARFDIVRLHPNETPRGCAYGLEIPRREMSRAAAILSKAGVKFTIIQ